MWEPESSVAAGMWGIQGLFVVGHSLVVVGIAAGVRVESLVGVAKEAGWRAAVGRKCLGSEGMRACQDQSCGYLGANRR